MNENKEMACEATSENANFIVDIIREELAQPEGRDHVHTRFPPEPNGYLHIGHAKAICLNFGTAKQFGGPCNLRMDDTNPAKEDMEYAEAIQKDIQWLGFSWDDLLFASDYYEKLYSFAEILIEKGKAYVDDLTPDEIRQYRGTLTEAGKNSPYRDRSVEENLALFRAMRAGQVQDGEKVLRAKIDMSSPNINMRDPIIYRVLRATHYRTGNDWCIYPMYDFAHPLSDAMEGITYSLCTMEFEDHRPLYNWFVQEVGLWNPPPRQIEFARLNLTQTIMSKRYLKKLVDSGVVSGWDDPRMPTICGIRRRGYTPQSIRDFCEMIGVAKSNSMVDSAMLEYCVRNDLNPKAHRMMGVIRPLKVILDNWPADKTETITLDNLPGQDAGTRAVTLGREIYIEADDFMEEPPKKFFRLSLGKEVRLKNAYIIKGESVEKDADGNVIAVHCSVDFDSTYGTEPVRKVKGTLHWLNTQEAVPAEIRLYDYLLLPEDESNADLDFSERMNPDSLTVLQGFVEPTLASYAPEQTAQFVRIGYFCADKDGTPERPVFNRVVGLKDTWGKMQKQS